MNVALRSVRVVGKFSKASKIYLSSLRAMSDEVSKAKDAKPGG